MGGRIEIGTPGEPPSGALPLRFEISRKAIHLASSTFPIAYATFLDRTALLIILGSALVFAMAIEFGRRTWVFARTWFERLAGFMLRDHEHTGEKSTWVGATWLLLAFTCVVALCSRPVAIAAMCAVSFGDAAAALVGRTVGRHTIGPTSKTFEGTFACLAAASGAAWWIAGLSIPAATATGICAAAAELPSRPFDDNVRVAAAAAIGAAIGVRLWG